MVKMSLRELIIRRDEGKCRLCKDIKNESDLEIHHIKHEQSDFDEIISTCDTCHTEIHKIETALRKGTISTYSCGRCKDKPRFLQHKFYDKSEIRICPNCLCGDQKAADGSIEAIWLGVEPLQILKEYLIEEGINLDPYNLIQKREPFRTSFQDPKPEWYKEIEETIGYLVQNKVKVTIDVLDRPFFEEKGKIW
uniref:Uncharacterized protein n=1 Tax=viral metagenome TaxID=1070528 RepID=A0A6M3LS80_9ZZZZ